MKCSFMMVRTHNRINKVVYWKLIVVHQIFSNHLQVFLVKEEVLLSIGTTTKIFLTKKNYCFLLIFGQQFNIMIYYMGQL